ncbi:MAG TPA: efflux RND transporter periplasmic adaptor subunit [Candidatus Limnocylindrales bacterium]|nr:efflux RND transporter periplasmic adaptor subunit [Candidatus Limnocylindrales bacterium]
MNVKTTATTLLLCLGMVACNSSKPLPQAPQAVQARQVDFQKGIGARGLRFSAVVMPDSQAQLAFRIPGYVVSLKQVRGQDGRMRDIAEGDRVTKGAVLAQMRATEYQDKVHQASSQVEAAEASAQKAKLDFDRASHLYQEASLTKPEFDAARAQYDSTQAQLRAAQAQTAEANVSLHDTVLEAPFSGEVVKKTVEIGNYVGPGVPTLAIANTETVKIVVGVPDTVVRSIRLGQAVEVEIDAFPGRTFHARISRVSSAADSTTRNFDVEVAIPNHDHLLKVGMIGSLQLANDSSGNHPAVLVIPLSAIVQASDGKYGVFVISNSGTGDVARLRTVEIGNSSGTDIAVLNGLASGEKIITSGANLLKDGQRVEVVQ